MGKSVCIVDFNGSQFCAGFWADWEEETGLVHFGGAWLACPPMPATEEPSEDAVYEWAFAHKSDTIVIDGKTYKLTPEAWVEEGAE